MKLKNILLTLIMGLSLLSCSKEQEPRVESVESMDVELSVNTLESRLAQEIENTETGATGLPVMAEKNLKIRVAVRQGNGSPCCQTLTFVKEPGRRFATYRGGLKYYKNGTGSFQISGILLGEDGGTAYTTCSSNEYNNTKVQTIPATTLNAPIDATSWSVAKVETKIPYVAKWTDLPLSSTGTSFKHVTMYFKPSGTLLRFRIGNTYKTAKTITALEIKTNAFVDTWEYDFTSLTGKNLKEGQTVNNTPVTETTKVYNLPAPLTLEHGGKSGWFYMWVMPKDGDTGLKTDIKAIFTNAGSTSSTIKKVLGFTTTKALKLGGVAVPLVLPTCSRFPDDHIPLEYLAKCNVKENGKLMDDDGVGTGGFFTYHESQNFSFQNFYIPKMAHWHGIFPSKALTLISNKQWPDDISENETVQSGGETTTFTSKSTYRHATPDKNGIAYALRFQDMDDGPNCRLTAYRYHYNIEIFSETQPKYLEIWSVFLGPDFEGDINTISQESFWTSPAVASAVVKRKMRVAGSRNADGSIYIDTSPGGSITTYYLSSEQAPGYPLLMVMMPRSIRAYSYTTPSFELKHMIRPLRKYPVK